MMSGVRIFRLLTGALAIAVTATLATAGPITAAHAADQPTLVISGPSATVTHGHPLTISGRLTTDTPAADTPVPAAPVDLQSRPVGGAWTTVDTKPTDGAGNVVFTHAADRTADWRLLHTADATAGEAVSATIRVSVRAALTAAWTRAAVRLEASRQAARDGRARRHVGAAGEAEVRLVDAGSQPARVGKRHVPHEGAGEGAGLQVLPDRAAQPRRRTSAPQPPCRGSTCTGCTPTS